MQTAQQEKRQRGRPFGSVGTKASKLRKIANKLKLLAETTAMEIVQNSLDGKTVDKEQLATAKFTITTAKQFHQAVVAEEENKKAEIDEAREEASIEMEEEGNGRAVFKLHMPRSE
jgi:hypothetical protein